MMQKTETHMKPKKPLHKSFLFQRIGQHFRIDIIVFIHNLYILVA